jgi:hypothetical protein
VQFRDRDALHLALAGISATIIAILAIAAFNLWHETEGPILPVTGIVAGLLGFLCAILAEYIRRWKGLTVSLLSLGFFLLWLLQGNAAGATRTFVVTCIVVCASLALLFAVPQLIVNLLPAVTRLHARLRRALPDGWWAS